MSVQDLINRWGAEKLALARHPVPDGTQITLDENLPSSGYCETCGPDPITVEVSGGGKRTEVYMSMGAILAELIAMEASGE